MQNSNINNKINNAFNQNINSNSNQLVVRNMDKNMNNNIISSNVSSNTNPDGTISEIKIEIFQNGNLINKLISIDISHIPIILAEYMNNFWNLSIKKPNIKKYIQILFKNIELDSQYGDSLIRCKKIYNFYS